MYSTQLWMITIRINCDHDRNQYDHDHNKLWLWLLWSLCPCKCHQGYSIDLRHIIKSDCNYWYMGACCWHEPVDIHTTYAGIMYTVTLGNFLGIFQNWLFSFVLAGEPYKLISNMLSDLIATIGIRVRAVDTHLLT